MNSTQPWRWFLQKRPNVNVSAAGITMIKNISRMSLKGVGFSFGEIEFAPTKPPPLVPSSLIASSEAIGPPVIVWVTPSSPLTSRYAAKFCGTPCQMRTSVARIEIGTKM